MGLPKLRRRIDNLGHTFLPDPNPTGDYSDADYDCTAAYMLLAHAEVEWYLEQRCRDLIGTVVAEWCLDFVPRATIVALVAFASGNTQVPESVGSAKPEIYNVVNDAKRLYSIRIHNNNGVKQKDVLALLLPLGIRESQFPSGFLNDMDVFGTWRGAQAHMSVGARAPLDPGDARNLVDRVMKGLQDVDGRLRALNGEGGCGERDNEEP